MIVCLSLNFGNVNLQQNHIALDRNKLIVFGHGTQQWYLVLGTHLFAKVHHLDQDTAKATFRISSQAATCYLPV